MVESFDDRRICGMVWSEMSYLQSHYRALHIEQELSTSSWGPSSIETQPKPEPKTDADMLADEAIGTSDNDCKEAIRLLRDRLAISEEVPLVFDTIVKAIDIVHRRHMLQLRKTRMDQR